MLFFRLLTLVIISSITAACASTPPCQDRTAWYEFTETEFCFPKESVVRLNHLNLPEPGAEVEFNPSGMEGPFSVSFIRQSDESGLSELSSRFNKSIPDFLINLNENSYSDADWQLISSVLRLESNTKIKRFGSNDTPIIAIIHHPEPFSSIYILTPGTDSHILLAGEMTESQVEWLVRHIGL